ncbi:MAG: DUF4132 domain-containing protein [Lachnospiraceae bacterium]|nr:DUF4132 domain-containing protein [Lachnospiraceae bacterium]
MEQWNSQQDGEKLSAMSGKARHKGGLIAALWKLAQDSYSQQAFSKVWDELTVIYGKQPHQLISWQEFWDPQLKMAISELVDDAFCEKIEELIPMRMEAPFSTSMWRRSYRSKDFGYYASRIISEICSCIYLTTYKQSVKEMLLGDHEWLQGYENLLAVEIRSGNKEIISLLEEAMLGDNGQLLLSTRMIRGIIISGHKGLLNTLLKLLHAARLQEGLRQAILENADAGSIETMTQILKQCIDTDMFRYSSVVRAFDAWTGLGYGDVKQSVVKKYAKLAYDCLTNEMLRKQYAESENNLEAFFALWSMGCYEIADTDNYVSRLLSDKRKYRKILGWYFVSHTDSEAYRMNMAIRYLKERDEEVLAWVISNLSVTNKLVEGYYYSNCVPKAEAVVNPFLPEALKDRRWIFEQLTEVANYVGNKNKVYSGNPFEFSSITLENSRVISCMMSLAGYDMNQELVEWLMDYWKDMSVEHRKAFCMKFMEPGRLSTHKAFLCNALEDRSIHVKELAAKRLADCELSKEELLQLANSLRSKSGSFRKVVISILQKQTASKIMDVIQYLLNNEEEYCIQAGIELMMQYEAHSGIHTMFLPKLEALKQEKLSTQTTILLDKLLADKNQTKEAYTEENGFGLYDPKETKAFASWQGAKCQTTALTSTKVQEGTQALREIEEEELFSEQQLKEFIPTFEEVNIILEKMNQVFERHADYEYEVEYYNGTREKVLFGNVNNNFLMIPAKCGKAVPGEYRKQKLSMVPFYEEFIEALGIAATDITKMLGLCYVTARHISSDIGPGLIYQEWFDKIEKKGLAINYHKNASNIYGRRYWQMLEIIGMLPKYFDAHEVFKMTMKVYKSMIRLVGEENLARNCVQKEAGSKVLFHSGEISFLFNHIMIVFWRTILKECAQSKQDFITWFQYEHRLELMFVKGVTPQITEDMANNLYWIQRIKRMESGLSMEDYFRACDEKIIPQAILYERQLLGAEAPDNMRVLTSKKHTGPGRELLQRYDWAKEFVDTLVHRIVEVEETRGELQTPLTLVARCIEYFEGAEYFCGLLAALGKENFFRGYEFSYDTTKKAVLSRLMKRCYPKKEDTPEALKTLLKATDISDKRLVEAVMYAPQWASLAEKVLGWQGLKCGIWFFHAHVNEGFSAEKETEVALYSPITPQEFIDGAFDKDWFLHAYEQLGEKRFQTLYKAAKYITAGSNSHRRSQLYADAVLGKLDAKELKAELGEKRNQERLRAYPLIPFKEEPVKEALERYEYIQRFLRESKQFGSQRRESEKKACMVALQNLAITMGLMDVNRMTWYLESEKLEGISHLFVPKELEDGVKVWLEIQEDGSVELAIEKDGKRQKTLPKHLSKNETVQRLKENKKDLKEQRQRAKECLERAMVEGTEFGVEELGRICRNPVLKPLLTSLVWTGELAENKSCGFLKAEASGLVLCGLKEQITPLKQDMRLRIAHPYDMMQAGEWSGFMKLVYQQKRIQPFKQVFREYYPIMEEELQERTISRRYAGHQIQPQKTVALLKGRGWTVDYEEGLQKVFYKEKIVVRMFALADWFSPADIEAPTLETVQFFHRDTGECIAFEELPPILFSEAMRDIDLVVSVAHVGGVDPETSHSTVEMRTAIATELIELLQLTNVEVIGSHAKIQGTLGNYSVHMGSGIVHAEGKGMLAILPVHSQARGRIFLPFVDDDPKTAEIMSKIILLAEDKKLKDPSILKQL